MDNTDNIPETLKRRILDYGDELLKRKAGEDTAKVTTLRNEALEHFSQTASLHAKWNAGAILKS